MVKLTGILNRLPGSSAFWSAVLALAIIAILLASMLYLIALYPNALLSPLLRFWVAR